MDTSRPKTFAEFWPFYVVEHSHRTNRILHFYGTAFGLMFLVLGITLLQPWFLLGMPLVGYGFAWLGHFYIEHNRPATFKMPLFSLLGDYKMFAFMCLGRMDFEVRRCRELLGNRRLP